MKNTGSLSILQGFIFLLLTFCSGQPKDKLMIKGFSLGMEFEKAKTHCQKIFSDAGIQLREFEEIIRKVDLSVYVTAWIVSPNEAVMEITANQEGKVTRFIFMPKGIQILFKPKETTDQALAEMLARHHQIPELKLNPFDKDRWEYEVLGGDMAKFRVSVKSGTITVEGPAL